MLFVQSQTLYGTTFYGGSAQGGILNQFVVGPNNLSIAKSFETFARHPQYTNLIQANDGKLYGMTSEGGGFNAGVIFSYDPTSSSFLRLKDFDIANGSYPYGSLMQAADGNLYGMTTSGGNNNRGVIFSYDPGSATYEELQLDQYQTLSFRHSHARRRRRRPYPHGRRASAGGTAVRGAGSMPRPRRSAGACCLR